MHQSRPVLPLEWSSESAHRLHDSYAYYANNMAAATQTSSEAFPDRRFPARSFVRSCNPLPSPPAGPPQSFANQNSIYHSACVASIVRVITFSQVILTDFTYTAVNTSMWSTIEQSIGIICACLITYQPLVSRLFSLIKGESSSAGENQRRESSEVYELGHLKRRSPIMNLSSNNASTAGFARLDEVAGMENSVTTCVSTTAESRRFMGSPEAILKNHTIEQHHDHLSGF